MNASRLIQRHIDTRNLPLGHYDRTRAEKDLDNEYDACHQAASKWLKRLKIWGRVDLHIACKITYLLCKEVEVKAPHKLYISSPEVQDGAVAHYNNKGIFTNDPFFYFGVLLHELAHHLIFIRKIRGGAHGEEFIACQEELFQAWKSLPERQSLKDLINRV